MPIIEDMNRSDFLLSVVICTFNRAELLARALGALSGQTLDSDQFEVVVVDDGSTDDTRRVVESFRPRLRLRYAYQMNAGLASGKNHGLFLSCSPIVLFLDDDDVADSNLLEQHYRSHQDYPQQRYAVLGYTDLTRAAARSPLMQYVTQIGCQLFSYPHLTDGDILDFSYFWGGRSSCKRMFLLENGVFNPVFRFGAEDIEAGFRLSKVGLKVIFNRLAVSHMIRTIDFDGFCRRCYRQGRSNWIFSQLHPEEAVLSWTRVEGIQQAWEKICPRYEQILKMGRDLDRLAGERQQADLGLDELTLKLLYRAYAAAFEASRIKGTASMQQDKERLPRQEVAPAN